MAICYERGAHKSPSGYIVCVAHLELYGRAAQSSIAPRHILPFCGNHTSPRFPLAHKSSCLPHTSKASSSSPLSRCLPPSSAHQLLQYLVRAGGVGAARTHERPWHRKAIARRAVDPARHARPRPQADRAVRRRASQSSRRQSTGGASKPRLTPQQKRELQTGGRRARLQRGGAVWRHPRPAEPARGRVLFDQPVPVDMVADYPEVIATPMWTIPCAASSPRATAAASRSTGFAADVRLIFMNAVGTTGSPTTTATSPPRPACARSSTTSAARAARRAARVTRRPAPAGGKAAKGRARVRGGAEAQSSIGTPGAASTPGAAGGGGDGRVGRERRERRRRRRRRRPPSTGVSHSSGRSAKSCTALLTQLAEYLEGVRRHPVDGRWLVPDRVPRRARPRAPATPLLSPQGAVARGDRAVVLAHGGTGAARAEQTRRRRPPRRPPRRRGSGSPRRASRARGEAAAPPPPARRGAGRGRRAAGGGRGGAAAAARAGAGARTAGRADRPPRPDPAVGGGAAAAAAAARRCRRRAWAIS